MVHQPLWWNYVLCSDENPNLPDIKGDTVKMVSKASKALMRSLHSKVDGLFSDVYYDIEKSPKQNVIFAEFQSLIHLSPKAFIRPISS